MTSPSVLLVHNRHAWSGGEDRVFEAELALLRARGHHVTSLVASNDGIEGRSRMRLASEAVWNAGAAGRLSEMCEAHRPDVVHFHNTFPRLSPAVVRAAHETGAAVVHTLHNYRLLCPNGLFFREGGVCEQCAGRRAAWPAIAHRCYRDSYAATAAVALSTFVHQTVGTWHDDVDAFIALSLFARQKFVRVLDPARVTYLPNFLDGDPVGGDHLGNFALFAGRISREKGILTLLEAWQLIGRRFELQIAGDGPLRAELQARFPDARWLGRLTPHAVRERMRAARFLVFPSQCYENCPITLLEAFSTGLPVIASDIGSVAELVGDMMTGLTFPAGDANALAERIEYALANPRPMAEFGRTGAQVFQQRFSADRHYRGLLEVYDHALRRRRDHGVLALPC